MRQADLLILIRTLILNWLWPPLPGHSLHAEGLHGLCIDSSSRVLFRERKDWQTDRQSQTQRNARDLSTPTAIQQAWIIFLGYGIAVQGDAGLPLPVNVMACRISVICRIIVLKWSARPRVSAFLFKVTGSCRHFCILRHITCNNATLPLVVHYTRPIWGALWWAIHRLT